MIVYCTVPDKASGEKIARALVTEGLCACVNRIPAVTSYYIYEDKFCEDSEELLIIKTDAAHFQAVEKRIAELHPYDVPEVIATEIKAGSAGYMKWLKEALKQP